jgi:hypothetical protein
MMRLEAKKSNVRMQMFEGCFADVEESKDGVDVDVEVAKIKEAENASPLFGFARQSDWSHQSIKRHNKASQITRHLPDAFLRVKCK